MKMGKGERVFQIFNYGLLVLISLMMVLPIIHVIAQSFSSNVAINSGKITFFPIEFVLSNYEAVIGDHSVWRAFLISVIVTVGGTFINLMATSSLAYPLSRSEYVGRKVVLIMVLVTLVFQAPLIPNYLLIKELQMLDTLWALVIPGAISTFNFFIMRSFFMNIPKELIDSARIDGSGEIRVLWNIVLPLSKPVMATMGIFYAVTHWNAYSNALYFINDRTLYPLQVRLREIVMSDYLGQANSMVEEIAGTMSPEGIKMAVIVISTLPIMLVYPFLQKHFVKGAMIGSIKS